MTYPDVAQRSLYDVRDNNSYVVRKLADGNCWMTSNLKLKMSANTAVVASKNDGSTFSYNPGAACTSNGACAINGNTVINTTYGGFYSWYAATAGQGTASSTGDINGSICPAGWKLPYNYTASNNKSYGGLLAAYGMPATNVNVNYVSTLEAMPLGFLRVGLYYSGSFINAGTSGDYWSSTASGAGTAYYLVYYTSLTHPQDLRNNYSGLSVRCVAL